MPTLTWNDIDNELNALLASWADEPVPTKPEEFEHLSSIELAQMCDHLGISNHGTHQQLCWRLADAENGCLSPTLLVANNPNPKVVLAPTNTAQTCQAEPKPEPTKGSSYRGAYGHKPASEYAPAPVTLVNGVDLSLCSYRDLQAKCKLEGLKANGSREVLIERLLNPTEADKLAAKKPKKSTKNGKCKQVQAPTAAPTSTTAEALTYRQAQRLVSWANDNVVWNKPCKNSGWDNIRTNLLDLVTTDHFTNLMADKAQVKELAIHLQVPATQLNALITATITA